MTTASSLPRWHLGPQALQRHLAALPLPAWRFYPVIASTNDAGLAWAAQGAAEGCLVLAEAQTQGRGRNGRRWWSAPRASLTMSLIVRPLPQEHAYLSRLTAWAAVALAETLEQKYHLQPAIKWPNDVLLNGRKVAGILAETLWVGEKPHAMVVGIGVNLATQAIPPKADFPATSLAHVLGAPPDAWALLAALLRRLLAWRYHLASTAFLKAWETRLAYRGEMVHINGRQARLLGLDEQGGLRLRYLDGQTVSVYALPGHLRPAGSPTTT